MSTDKVTDAVIEEIARAWASIDGKSKQFDDCKADASLEDEFGHYGGYMAEARELVRRSPSLSAAFVASVQHFAGEPVGFGCFDKGLLFATFHSLSDAEDEARMHQDTEVYPVYRHPPAAPLADAKTLIDGFEKAFLNRMLVETDGRKRAYEKARVGLLAALSEAEQQPVAVKPQCCMCGRKDLSTVEGDGGTECELPDGRWVCSFDCWDRAVAPPAKREAGEAAAPVQDVVGFDLPADIIESLLAIGPVEWGVSLTQSDEKHASDLLDTLRITREHFGVTDEETGIHGVYLEGTGTVLAHTGMSPNSPQHARILVGAWNQLVEIAKTRAVLSTPEGSDNG